ncbi:MAG: hypothetical protein J6R96_02805, partial [Spirochaetaceae bacterium]|nr:hypothetical protein [Spirochaetaceae bacterium]
MRKLSRKEAEGMMEVIFSALHYNLMDAMNAGGERTGEESYFHAEAWKVDQGRQKEDYRQTVMSLDSVGFKEYYKLVGQFATAYKIGCWKEYSECEPILIEELGEELGRREKTKEKLELINSFRLEELHSQTFSFDAKIKALQDILDDFRVGNEKEEVINRLLASFSGKDSGAFIARLQSDRKLLNGLLGRVNGGEKDWMLALLGEIFASAGLTAEEKAVSLENKASDTLKATFEQGQVFIDVNSPVPGGMRDYTKAKAKSIMVSPFEIIRMNYDGREIKIPALLLLKSWTNSGATPEGLFQNYYKEDLDWNSLGEEERDAYFAEFVAHYLPRGFIEALVSPLQLVITGLITVGLAVTTGGASVIAQLELALSVAGIALTAASTVGSLQGMMAANKMKEAAGTTHEAKKAAKEMAESIAQLSLSAVDLLLAGKGFLQAKSKNVVAVVDSTKKSPEEILQEAGYKRGKEINDYSAKVKELQKYYTKPKPPELPQTSFPVANATSTEIVTAVNQGTSKALATVSQMSVLQSEKAALQEMVADNLQIEIDKNNAILSIKNEVCSKTIPNEIYSALEASPKDYQLELFNMLSNDIKYQLVQSDKCKWITDELFGYDITKENVSDYLKLEYIDGDMKINLDWPFYGGYKPESIKGLDYLFTKGDGKIEISRMGGDFGVALGYGRNADGTFPSAAARSLLKTEKQSFVTTGIMDLKKYKDIV